MENYRVTALTLNVRNAASIDAAVVNSLHKGDVVELAGKSADDYWYKVKKDAVDGWASHKWLELVAPHVQMTEQFPWMPIALAEIGTKEVDGNGNNPRILSYLATTTLDTSAAETRQMKKRRGVRLLSIGASKKPVSKARTNRRRAVGKIGELILPRRVAAVSPFSRRAGGNHVGFYISETED